MTRDPVKIDVKDSAENTKKLENLLKKLKVGKGLWMKDMDMAEHLKCFKAL